MNDSEELESLHKALHKVGYTPVPPVLFFSSVRVCVCVCGGGGGGGGLRGGLIEEDGFDTIIYSCSVNVEKKIMKN